MGKAKEPEKLKVIKDDIEYEFEAAEEGGYVASVPLYPSCVSQGETLEEALANEVEHIIGREISLKEWQSL